MTTQAKLGFYFDTNQCIGCKSCESACAEWNGLDFGVRWRQVVGRVIGSFPDVRRAHLSMACNNCEAAPCVASCPTGALRTDGELGLVQLDEQKCIGCRYCEWACPYGAIQYNAKLKKVSKCTLCADRLQADLAPACVTSCPTGCLQFGDLAELKRAHPKAGADQPGVAPSNVAKPNMLLEPHRQPLPTKTK